jgi:hypothetical protein
MGVAMEEIEIMSWLTLDAIKKAADVVETVGDLQAGHCKSVFCSIEDDYLELYYSDTGSNLLRRYENKDEFEAALEERKEEVGETPYEEESAYDEDIEEEKEEEEGDYDLDDGSDKY